MSGAHCFEDATHSRRMPLGYVLKLMSDPIWLCFWQTIEVKRVFSVTVSKYSGEMSEFEE